MELCRGGDLLHYVRKRKKLDEDIAKILFKQLIEGIQYIHRKNVVHRDIKLENILIDNLGKIKICDFGISKLLKGDADELMNDCCGTPAYMAPEVVATEP
jgi:serine/threonine protein kinase